MNEKDRSSRYEQMLPQELNTILIRVYRRIPKAHLPEIKGGIHSQEDLDLFAEFTNQASRRAMRRARSERKKHLVEMHSELIKRSHLTPFFKDSISNSFSGEYDFGLSPDIYTPEELPKSSSPQFNSRDLLDLDNPGSPGIFDPEKAKEIERKAYNAALSKRLDSRNRLDRLGIQAKEVSELKFEREDKGEWLNQFLQKHRELP